MRLDRDSFRLFGLDLFGVFDYLREGLREAGCWRWLAWLSPQEPVCLIAPDGTRSIRRGVSPLVVSGRVPARTIAVELDEEVVLVRRLRLPRLATRELEAALLLQARALSPFPEDDLVWGWRRDAAGDGLALTLVMVSRAEVERRVDRLGVSPEERPEVWFDGDRPVLIRGFGENVRARRERRTRGLLLIATVSLPVLALIAAAAPVYRAANRADEAQVRLAALQKQAAPSIDLRERLVKLRESAAALGQRIADPGRELDTLDLLTKVIPDDAMVSRAEFRGPVLRLTGIADDGTRVLQLLTNRPEFAEVKALAPFSRIASGKESFSIELALHERGTGK